MLRQQLLVRTQKSCATERLMAAVRRWQIAFLDCFHLAGHCQWHWHHGMRERKLGSILAVSGNSGMYRGSDQSGTRTHRPEVALLLGPIVKAICQTLYVDYRCKHRSHEQDSCSINNVHCMFM